MDKHSNVGHRDTERFDEEYDDLNQIHQTCGHRFSFDKSPIDNQFSFILLYSLRSSCWENKTPCSSNTESGLSLIINVFYYLLIIHTCFIGHQTKLWLTFSSQVCFIYAARITTTFPQLGLQSGELNDILRPETLDSREEKLPRHNKKKPGNREKKRGRNVGESQTIHCHFIKSFLERFVLLIHHNLNKSCIYCLVDTLLAAAESFQTSLLWSFCVESPQCPLLIRYII